MNEYSQLGISGLTLAILFFVVRYFVSAIREKDNQINNMIKDFSCTINNHIVHATEQTKLQNVTFNDLANAIKKLTIQIKNGADGTVGDDNSVSQSGYGGTGSGGGGTSKTVAEGKKKGLKNI